ncbi:MAG: D-alanyl-D-alanine carboxypeptidase [Saprospiraceae bacterium]
MSSKIPVSKNFKHDFEHALINSKILNGSTIGLAVFDLNTGQKVFGYNDSNRLIPASNIKILTLYGAKHFLEDSLQTFKYVVNDTTLYLWACGDGTLLKNDLPESNIIQRLKSMAKKRKVFISNQHVNVLPLGKGWMWDDYDASYQAEICAMPIHGNAISFFGNGSNISEVVPDSPMFKIDMNATLKNVGRERDKNHFHIGKINYSGDWRIEVPIHDANTSNKMLLEEYLGTEIKDTSLKIPLINVQSLYSLPIDTVLKLMMENSDNMLAEQLLLQVGMKLGDTLNSQFAIDTLQKVLYADIRHNMRWVDGSGLSRYNLISPEDITTILRQIYTEFGKEKTFDLMPKMKLKTEQSTKSKEDNRSEFILKTGSMSGVYNVSGYLSKPSGNTYAISFMTNGNVTPISNIRKEVHILLQMLTDQLK